MAIGRMFAEKHGYRLDSNQEFLALAGANLASGPRSAVRDMLRVEGVEKKVGRIDRFMTLAESSLYFSGVTYTTIGYGDLVLPKEWRLFGPVEGLIGILMCGLSTAFLFATLSRLYRSRTKTNQDPADSSANC